jgi:SAM-dependent methyltransferase
VSNDELDRLATVGWIAPEPAEDGVRYFASTDGTAISYPEEGFDVLGLDGGSGFWFDHRASAVSRHIERLGISSMWEVGAGTGAMAHRLRGTLTEVVTVEPLAAGARASAALGMTSLCGSLQDLGLPDGTLESIGVFDVLEHLEQPDSLVDEMHRVLRPSGVVIATVPAFQALWGDEDDVAGHHRRYKRSTLDADFASSGFSRLRSEYLFASLVPPAGVLRALPYRLGRRSSREAVLQTLRAQLQTRPTTDRLARAVLAAETAVAKVAPLPFGLTVLGVFRKR